MRLSPPITILAIVAAAFAALAFNRNLSDCAYGPQGNLRWNGLSDWFQSVSQSDLQCDVWQGIAAKKPIEIIEIEHGSAFLRAFPDGTVAVVLRKDWKDHLGYLENSERPHFRSTDELHRDGYQVIEMHAGTKIYDEVRALIAPMRDFVGWRYPNGELLFERNRFMREVYYAIDDPKTRIGICRHQIFDSGAGWLMQFWSAGTKQLQSWSFYPDIGCYDAAARAGMARVDKAAVLILTATGSKNLVEARNEGFYPALP